jgi:hypothetical protein
MTEFEALFKTILLWSYIAKHSNISKVEAYNALNRGAQRIASAAKTEFRG